MSLSRQDCGESLAVACSPPTDASPELSGGSDTACSGSPDFPIARSITLFRLRGSLSSASFVECVSGSPYPLSRSDRTFCVCCLAFSYCALKQIVRLGLVNLLRVKMM